MPNLPDSAVALLRTYREPIPVHEGTEADCRQLEAEGLLVLSRPFVGEPAYRPTKMGWKLIEVLELVNEPSLSGSASPRP